MVGDSTRELLANLLKRRDELRQESEALERLIETYGRPLTRSELLRRLEGEGYVVDGKDKPKVLGTNLWRSGQFRHVGKLGYWPKSTPMPGRFAEKK